MNKFYLILISLVIITCTMYSQPHEPPFGRFGPREQIEKIEKIKLIELLDLDEETSIRFFSRRNKHMNEQKEIFKLRDSLLTDLENKISEEEEGIDYIGEMDKLFILEEQHLENKKKFHKSLSDILTPEQIAMVTIFEVKFRRELRDQVLRKHRRRFKD